MTFTEKIRKRLAELGRSQGDLADGIGTSQSQLSAWLGQGLMPSTAFVIKTAKYLGVSLDYLLDDAAKTTSPERRDIELVIMSLIRRFGASVVIETMLGSDQRDPVALSWNTLTDAEKSDYLHKYEAVRQRHAVLRAALHANADSMDDAQKRLAANRTESQELAAERGELRRSIARGRTTAKLLEARVGAIEAELSAIELSFRNLGLDVEADVPSPSFVTMGQTQPRSKLTVLDPPPLAPPIAPPPLPKRQKASDAERSGVDPELRKALDEAKKNVKRIK